MDQPVRAQSSSADQPPPSAVPQVSSTSGECGCELWLSNIPNHTIVASVDGVDSTVYSVASYSAQCNYIDAYMETIVVDPVCLCTIAFRLC